MIRLTSKQAATLRSWFLPDRPGPLIGLHALHTGQGSFHADRWPAPSALLVEVAGNYSMAGNPARLSPAFLQARVAGFLEAPAPFEPLLQLTFPGATKWPRVILARQDAPVGQGPPGFKLRLLSPGDAASVRDTDPDVTWIAKTWGGPAGMAASGYAWGAFAGDQLTAIACTFFVGERYEEIGVATEPAYRGRGLAGACASFLCQDIAGRGRQPSWSTSPDNAPSLRVAKKLGFTLQRRDRLFVIGMPPPPPPTP